MTWTLQGRLPGANRYRHVQGSPAATWVVTHGLGRKPPVVIVLDGNDDAVFTDVSYVSDDVLSIEFPSPVSGTADM